MYKIKERILNADLRELKKNMVEHPDKPVCKFIWGPEGVGKSELMKSWFEGMDTKELKDNNIFYFWLDLKTIENTGMLGLWEIWKNLIMQFKDSIPQDVYESEADTIEEIYELMENSAEQITEEYDEDAKVCIYELFEAFTYVDVHIKIVLNHFEEVLRIFPKATDNGYFFMQLFDLSPKGSLVEKNLSILLLSECYPTRDMIHHMEYHSEFTDGYNVIYLGAYCEKEMELYYETLVDEMGPISDEQKESIEYYCGRHPKMLEIMYELLIKADDTEDIDRIIEKDGAILKDYYKQLLKKLNKRKYLVEIESDEAMYEYGYLFKGYDSRVYLNLSEAFKEFI